MPGEGAGLTETFPGNEDPVVQGDGDTEQADTPPSNELSESSERTAKRM